MGERSVYFRLCEARDEFEEITRCSFPLNRQVVPVVNRILEGDTPLSMPDRLTVIQAVVEAIKAETKHTAKVARALEVLRTAAAVVAFVTMSAHVRTH